MLRPRRMLQLGTALAAAWMGSVPIASAHWVYSDNVAYWSHTQASINHEDGDLVGTAYATRSGTATTTNGEHEAQLGVVTFCMDEDGGTWVESEFDQGWDVEVNAVCEFDKTVAYGYGGLSEPGFGGDFGR